MENHYTETRFHDFREIINHSANEFGKREAFRYKNAAGKYETVTYSILREHYYRFCSCLLRIGLRGKRIAVIGKNSYEWVLAYLCAATVGVAVPIDKDLSQEDIESFLVDADCQAVCSDESTRSAIHQSLTIDFQTVLDVASGSFYEIGAYSGGNHPIDESAVDAIELPKDEMQVLIFTSGTTGHSKGVCLSQFNICSDIFSTVSIVKILPQDRTLSILPLHHTYECTLNCLLLLSRGASISFCEGLKRITTDITETRPSILVVVPELLRFMDKKIRKTVAESCPKQYQTLFENLSFSEAMKKLPSIVRVVIRHKVRKQLGGNLRLFIVGAANLDTGIVDDFCELRIRTLQGYGLTECAPLLAGNNDFYMNAASTGVAIPGVSLKIDNPNAEGIGEILAKGENIMLGYYNDPEATAKVFRDGWFCTGDLGRLGKDGELYITGRLKNVIVTENGKNIYPEEIETRLSGCPVVEEVLVLPAYPRERICVKAKILPNLSFLKEMLGRIPTAGDINFAVRQAVESINSKIPSYKHITVIEVLTEALEKTTTRKAKRCGDNLN